MLCIACDSTGIYFMELISVLSDVYFPAAVFFACVTASAVLFLIIGIKLGGMIFSAGMKNRVKTERADAVRRSRAVLTGQMAEQISPVLPGFPVNPAEARFIGKPVDFIAFTGLSSGSVSEVVFVEVKSGSSRLSPVEESLKEAVKAGRVRYEEFRVPV